MTPKTFSEITRLLQDGDEKALDRVFAIVYDDLRAVARNHLARLPASATIQPTALVHETYVRLLGKAKLRVGNRKDFFALAARAMHDIVVEDARRHAALKRGGRHVRLPLDENTIAVRDGGDQVLMLSDAIRRLRSEDPLAAEVVMLHFFAGLTHAETAELLELPVIRVRREWSYAKAYLHRELQH